MNRLWFSNADFIYSFIGENAEEGDGEAKPKDEKGKEGRKKAKEKGVKEKGEEVKEQIQKAEKRKTVEEQLKGK